MKWPTPSGSLSLDLMSGSGHSPRVWGAITSVITRRARVTPSAVQDSNTVAMFLWKLLVTFLFPASYWTAGCLQPKPSKLQNKMCCFYPDLPRPPTTAQKLKYLVFFAVMSPINRLTQQLIQLPPTVLGCAEAETLACASQLLCTRVLDAVQVLRASGT